MNTLLGGSMGCIFAAITFMFTKLESTGEYMFNLTVALNGALSGLVAITAACGCVETCDDFLAVFLSSSCCLSYRDSRVAQLFHDIHFWSLELENCSLIL